MKGLLLRMWYMIRLPFIAAEAVLLILAAVCPTVALMLLIYAAMIISVVMCRLLIADETPHFNRWRLILPLRRRTITDAYYLAVLFLTACLMLPAALAELQYHSGGSVLYFSWLVTLSLLMPAVFYPAALRFGRTVGAVCAFAALFLEMYGFLNVSMIKVDQVIFFDGAEQMCFEWFETLPGPAALVIFGISRMISVRVIENREF